MQRWMPAGVSYFIVELRASCSESGPFAEARFQSVS